MNGHSDDHALSTLRHIKSRISDSTILTPPHRLLTGASPKIQDRSPANKSDLSRRAASTPPERTNDGQSRQRSQTEGNGPLQTTDSNISWSRMTLSKKKSQYYDEAFAFRQSSHSRRARSVKDFPVIVEVKMNCHLESEHTFQTDIAFLLSEIYQRPAACVMVLTDTNFSILLNTSTEPAYYVAITVLTPEVASTKNKRTAGLVQDFMAEAVSIPADRGAIVFIPVAEENVSVNVSSPSKHALAGKATTAMCSSPTAMTERQKRKSKKPATVRRQSHRKTPDLPQRATTPLFWSDTVSHGRDARSTSVDNQDKKKVRRRKSFMGLFGF